VEIVWSCFGPLAPTPTFPGTPTYDLLKKGVKEPTHIVFRSLVLDEAVNDIKKILRSGKLPIAPRTQGASGPYKNRIWDKRNCSMIFGAFKGACGNVSTEGTGVGDGGLGDVVNDGDLLVDFF